MREHKNGRKKNDGNPLRRIYLQAIIWIETLVAQTVKNLPAMEETQVWPLGQKDPLEKGMATHSSILAWRIPWTEEPGRLQSMGSQRVGHDWATSTFTSALWQVRSSASPLDLGNKSPFPSCWLKGYCSRPLQSQPFPWVWVHGAPLEPMTLLNSARIPRPQN